MTQSFDEWMNKNHGGLFDMPHQRECFEAGAQSRQAEIDELKRRIDEALNILCNFNCPQEYGIDEIWKAEDLLKGNKDENN